jgi:hypothetical protein
MREIAALKSEQHMTQVTLDTERVENKEELTECQNELKKYKEIYTLTKDEFDNDRAELKTAVSIVLIVNKFTSKCC